MTLQSHTHTLMLMGATWILRVWSRRCAAPIMPSLGTLNRVKKILIPCTALYAHTMGFRIQQHRVGVCVCVALTIALLKITQNVWKCNTNLEEHLLMHKVFVQYLHYIILSIVLSFFSLFYKYSIASSCFLTASLTLSATIQLSFWELNAFWKLLSIPSLLSFSICLGIVPGCVSIDLFYRIVCFASKGYRRINVNWLNQNIPGSISKYSTTSTDFQARTCTGILRDNFEGLKVPVPVPMWRTEKAP